MNPRPRLAAITALMILVSVLSIVSCGLLQTSPPELPQELPELVWPNPPEIPRIKYLKSIATPMDLGIRKSVWRKIWEFIVGSEEEKIVKPYGIKTDAAGTIYIADSVDRVIHIFDPERKSYRKIGDPTILKLPIDLAITPRGEVFLSDAELGLVFKYDSGGKYIGQIGREGNLKRPAGITYNRVNDLVYVVDVLQNAVLAYDPAGTLKGRFGSRGTGNGQFNFPTNIVADAHGRLYVTDSLNFRVQIFDAQGNFVSAFGRAGDALGEFSKPKGIAIDSEGHLYVVEGLYDTVVIFDQQGRLLLNFGTPGSGPGQFWLATGIHVDLKDRIYVADSYNNRIQIFQYLRGPKVDAR
jgi:DNA-binding beta-propeller fold protein YncE